MSAALYGLSFEKDLNHEAYLILSRNEPPLGSRDLVSLEKKMLESYTVPKLLPLEFEEKDLKIKLRYRIPSGMTLYQAVKKEPVSIHQVYKILYAIVQVLEDSRIYMLSEQRYVIKENYIFVGKDLNDLSNLSMVYLPLEQLPEKHRVQEEIVQLADFLARHTKVTPGEHWKKLQTIMSGKEPFSLLEFKNLLQNGLKKLEVEGNGTGDRMFRDHAVHVLSEDELNYTQIDSQRGMSHEAANEPQSSSSGQLAKTKAVLGCAVILVLAGWSYYMNDPSEALIYICLGITLLAVDLIYVLHGKGLLTKELFAGKRLFDQVAESSVETSVESKDQTGGDSRGNVGESVEAWAASRVSMLSEMAADEKEPQPVIYNESQTIEDRAGNDEARQGYYDTLSQQTTLLVPQDATVLLADPFSGSSSEQLPLLEIEREDGNEQVELTESCFRIGRSGEGVHYTDTTVGVSRIHLEFLRQEDNATYAIKDLGSKNGSYLNEEQMIPYKEYVLKDQDRIRMAEVRLLFHLRSPF